MTIQMSYQKRKSVVEFLLGVLIRLPIRTMESRRGDCGFLPMSPLGRGLITLTLLVLCSYCSTQGTIT